MRISRLLFDESETPESIAQRIVRAFDPGETFCVRGRFFRVSGGRTANETVRENVIGDKYTLVLDIGEPEPPQPITVVPGPQKQEPEVVEVVEELASDPLPSEPPRPPPSQVVQSQFI